MRLGCAYVLCKKHYEVIKELDSGFIYNSDITNYGERENQIWDILNQLSNIEYLKKSAQSFMCLCDNIKINAGLQPDIGIFHKERNSLCQRMEHMIEVCESFGLSQEELIGLDIKLPPTDNLTDFKKNLDDLEFVLTKCPFCRNETSELRFGGVDIGSVWLVLPIAGVSASVLLNNIAAFIDKCLIIKSHKLTIDEQKNEIERLAKSQEQKDAIINGLNELLKVYVENAIRELEDSTGCKISDGDERGKATQSFEKLGKLIDKGLQIYGSIDLPAETKALFEPLEMKYLSIEKEIKALEKKSDKKDDD